MLNTSLSLHINHDLADVTVINLWFSIDKNEEESKRASLCHKYYKSLF